MESAAKQSPEVSVRELIEAGAHFGHQTDKWNPKMKPFIHSARNGVYIIDLQKTATRFRLALEAIKRVATSGQKVLFVGTKRQAKDIITEESKRAGQFYIAERWIGGTLTNFHTIRRSINQMKNLQKMNEEQSYGIRKKKEILTLEKKRIKLERYLGGIQDMNELPGAIFVIDPQKEYIAVNEARNLGIPIIAVIDTNCNPDGIDYPIPGNDDSLRAVQLYANKVAEAIIEGAKKHQENIEKMGSSKPKAAKPEAAPEASSETKVIEVKKTPKGV